MYPLLQGTHFKETQTYSFYTSGIAYAGNNSIVMAHQMQNFNVDLTALKNSTNLSVRVIACLNLF